MNVADRTIEHDKIKRNSFLVFLSLIILAFIVSYIPFLNLPFTWMQTYFHEVSHGLTAMLTGGSVQLIELHLNGSGLCTTQGGIRFFVAFSGYLGAIFWGALMYMMVNNINKKSAVSIAGTMIAMIVISAICWSRDFTTWIIMGAMIVPLTLILKTNNQLLVKYFLQFLGLYILLDAIKSPLYLIDGRRYGDGYTLSELTGVPETIWIIIWFGIGLGTLYLLWKGHVKRGF